MKNITFSLVFSFLVGFFSIMVFAKQKQEKDFRVEIVKPKTHISDYSIFNTYFFDGTYSQGFWSLVENYRATGRSYHLLPFKDKKGNVVCLDPFFDTEVVKSDQHRNDKIVLYIEPFKGCDKDRHIISFKDHLVYQAHNIGVFELRCDFKGPRFGSFISLDTDPVLCFSLLSDNNKKINIYRLQAGGFYDDSRYGMSNRHRTAILIDNNNYIVSILDNVKSEKDVFKAFGIK